jgi:hypothetical protein
LPSSLYLFYEVKKVPFDEDQDLGTEEEEELARQSDSSES